MLRNPHECCCISFKYWVKAPSTKSQHVLPFFRNVQQCCGTLNIGILLTTGSRSPKKKLGQAKDGFPICFPGFPSFLGDFSPPLLRISYG